MKSLKVLLLLAGLSTGLVASENNGSADFMSRMSAQFASLTKDIMKKSSDFGTSALTTGNDYLVKPLSQAGSTVVSTVSNAATATLNAGNENVVKPVSQAALKVVAAISNSSAAKTVSDATATAKVKMSEFGSSVAKSATDATTVVTTKASEFGSVVVAKSTDAAAYVSKSATASYNSSAKFCEENPAVVGAALFATAIVTYLAIVKYQQDGYLFYANEEASDKDAA